MLYPITIEGLQDHVLVIVEKVKASPAAYPRDPAQRRRRPLAIAQPLPSA